MTRAVQGERQSSGAGSSHWMVADIGNSQAVFALVHELPPSDALVSSGAVSPGLRETGSRGSGCEQPRFALRGLVRMPTPRVDGSAFSVSTLLATLVAGADTKDDARADEASTPNVDMADLAIDERVADAMLASKPWMAAVPWVVASVRTGMAERLVDAVATRLGAPTYTLTSLKETVARCYRPPASLGDDRLANALEAHARWGGAAICVDAGTATTFDCVDGDGRFVGGAIAPGLVTAATGLHRAAPALPRWSVEAPSMPAPCLALDSQAAIHVGHLHGHASMMEGMVHRLMRSMGHTSATCPVVLTGGHAAVLSPYLSEDARAWHVDPLLTVFGIARAGCLMQARG